MVFVGYKNKYFEYASLINSGLLVFFRLIFDQEVYCRVRKFYGLVFFRVVFYDFRRSSLSFLHRSTPPPASGSKIRQSATGFGFNVNVFDSFKRSRPVTDKKFA